MIPRLRLWWSRLVRWAVADPDVDAAIARAEANPYDANPWLDAAATRAADRYRARAELYWSGWRRRPTLSRLIEGDHRPILGTPSEIAEELHATCRFAEDA